MIALNYNLAVKTGIRKTLVFEKQPGLENKSWARFEKPTID